MQWQSPSSGTLENRMAEPGGCVGDGARVPYQETAFYRMANRLAFG